jgi:hypothetical protein
VVADLAGADTLVVADLAEARTSAAAGGPGLAASGILSARDQPLGDRSTWVVAHESQPLADIHLPLYEDEVLFLRLLRALPTQP